MYSLDFSYSAETWKYIFRYQTLSFMNLCSLKKLRKCIPKYAEDEENICIALKTFGITYHVDSSELLVLNLFG